MFVAVSKMLTSVSYSKFSVLVLSTQATACSLDGTMSETREFLHVETPHSVPYPSLKSGKRKAWEHLLSTPPPGQQARCLIGTIIPSSHLPIANSMDSCK